MDERKLQLQELLNTALVRPDADNLNVNALDIFLSSSDETETINNWMKLITFKKSATAKEVLRIISAQIAIIDELINNLLNSILHNPIFQAMEARWRGLYFLTQESALNKNVKIRLLDITWNETHKDLTRLEFDQSALFEKIYNEEFGTPGGKPFGLLINDHYVNLQEKNSRKDIDTLTGLADIASVAFCPIILGVAPESFEVDSFSDITFTDNLPEIFKQPAYFRWNNFRKNSSAKFVGLTLPHVLMRTPYAATNLQENYFCFHEDVHQPKQKGYLWGNTCFAFALSIIRSFNLTSWFGYIRGVPSDLNKFTNGEISQLPVTTHETEKSCLNTKFATEILIDECDESIFSELGFISFCTNKKTGHALLYNSMSASKVADYYSDIDYDVKISANLQYILCASRFAHYIKVISRDSIGEITDATELQIKLTNWIRKYIAKNEIDDILRAKYPLQDAQVKISEIPGKPGSYNCIINLQPRYQLEKVNTALTLTTELAQISS